MAKIRKGRFLWPGVRGPIEGQYTFSQGVSNGTATLICHRDEVFAEVGDLIITDDVAAVRIPDCKVDRARIEYHEEHGYVLMLEILDWRWKWKDLGAISGAYNQLDPHGKLIPWTIRSPEELAVLCLRAMGVKKFEIDMPAGLDSAVGEEHIADLNPPWIGVIPTTGTNPAINWVAEPPALALENLANLFGRRVVCRLSDYTVTIVRPGFGADLPPGSIARRSPAIDSPETPLGVAVLGAPTKYQMRLRLEAVGEEWDGSYRPINDLSYTPVRPAKVAEFVLRVAISGASWAGVTLQLNVTFEGVTYGFTYDTTGAETAAAIAADFASQLGASQDLVDVLSAVASGGDLTITGLADTFDFSVSASSDGQAVSFNVVSSSPSSDGEPSWESSAPHALYDALETSRLTKVQAWELAQRSVFRCYRVRDADVSVAAGENDDTPIKVPGYGDLVRRQQVVLTDTQVEQVKPQPGDQSLLLTAGPFTGMPGNVLHLYSGYSRDKPAVVFGSVWQQQYFQFWHRDQGDNTADDHLVHVPFSVDPEQQIVRFSQPVFKRKHSTGAPRITAPDLVLQTGVFVRNAESNEIERMLVKRLNANAKGLTNLIVRNYDDVQLNVIGHYNAQQNIVNVTNLEQDPFIRAEHYLDGMQAQYFATTAEIVEYNGFEAINLDGAIQQVTWEFGEQGCRTIASRNTEHQVYVPPYPARRRAEFLRPAMEQNLMNAADRPRLGQRLYQPD